MLLHCAAVADDSVDPYCVDPGAVEGGAKVFGEAVSVDGPLLLGVMAETGLGPPCSHDVFDCLLGDAANGDSVHSAVHLFETTDSLQPGTGRTRGCQACGILKDRILWQFGLTILIRVR